MIKRSRERKPALLAGRAALLAAVALGVASCRPSSSSQSNATDAASFDRSLHDSCVTSAIARQANANQAERYCSCLVGKLSGMRVEVKQKLTPTSPQVTQDEEDCRAEVLRSSSPRPAG